MVESTAEPAPTSVDVATTPHAIARNLRVVDASTGEPIAKVIAADAPAGRVKRFDVDDDGNMVRRDNVMLVIEEDRAIRIEWIDPAAETLDAAEAA